MLIQLVEEALKKKNIEAYITRCLSNMCSYIAERCIILHTFYDFLNMFSEISVLKT